MAGNIKAFPVIDHFGGNEGMDLRDYFAAHAPDVPSWFDINKKFPEDPAGKDGSDFLNEDELLEFNDLNKLSKNNLLTGVQKARRDMLFDMIAIRRDNQIMEYRIEKKKWRIELLTSWRWFYADAMMESRGEQ